MSSMPVWLLVTLHATFMLSSRKTLTTLQSRLQLSAEDSPIDLYDTFKVSCRGCSSRAVRLEGRIWEAGLLSLRSLH